MGVEFGLGGARQRARERWADESFDESFHLPRKPFRDEKRIAHAMEVPRVSSFGIEYDIVEDKHSWCAR